MMEVYGLSKIGLTRKTNQDRLVVVRRGSCRLIAVADGMGGHKGGEKAATIMARRLREFAPGGDAGRTLLQLVRAAHKDIQEESRRDPKLEGMGTTVLALCVDNGVATFVHSGDCRLYHLRGGKATQVTRDHSFLQDFIDSGEMTPEQAAEHPMSNLLDQCVGCPGLKPDTGQVALAGGDTILVCSDGFHRHVSPDMIARALSNGSSLRHALNKLVQIALDGGGQDNITVAALR